jgi:cell fate regulator YaaT (PSP1 superfamily)
MELPSQDGTFDVVEVRFKNGRKEYLRNPQQLRLYMGDVVAVEGSPGHDVGAVSLTGELVRLQLKKRKIDPEKAELKKIFRKANPRDISLWKEAQEREEPALIRGREIIHEMGLPMKLSDVEYQADKAKATFYFTAEGRVDFRELIKRLATEFHLRVEMRQIGSRQEAGRIGGIGSCGRELCCSTWLTDFRSVSTSAARYQQLSLNPQKLAGQCGKLKCCLNFELDTYLDALKQFPKTQYPLVTQKGKAHFQKMDIFKEIMWYAYEEEGSEWVALHRDTVKKLQKEIQEGQKPESLEMHSLSQPEPQVAYQNAVGDDDLTRFDHKGKKSRKKGRKPRQRGKNKAQNPQKRGRA